MNLHSVPIKNFEQALKQQGKKQATIEAYCRDAKHFLKYLADTGTDLSASHPKELVEYQRYLANVVGDRRNSIRRSTIGVRQFFRFLSSEKSANVDSPFDNVAIPERGHLSLDFSALVKIGELLEREISNSPDLRHSRDAVILSLLGYEGLKTSEILELTWVDYLGDTTSASLRIKSGRHRCISIFEGTRLAIDHYYKISESMRAQFGEQLPAQAMIVAFKGKDGTYPLPGMSRHGVKFILYELGKSYGIPHLNSELLRHHALAHQLDLGKSPEDLMRHLGLKRMGNIKIHLAQRAIK